MSMSNYTISKSIEFIEQDEGCILFDKRSGKYLQVNDIGRTITEFLIEEISVEEIGDRIAADYQVSRNVVLTDVKNFLTLLVEQGVLQ